MGMTSVGARIDGAVGKIPQLMRLRQRNLRSHQSVVADSGVVLSLTTYGRRIQSVYLTIESIGAGKMRPRRLMLWLEASDLALPLPPTLKRLQSRGLEVLQSENYRAHGKIYPYAQSDRDADDPCATVDDDVIYPSSWLVRLHQAYESAPECINGYRARVIRVEDGRLSPYSDWPKCTDSAAAYTTFLTGVSGIIYPSDFLDALRAAGPSFRELCPTADDVWLHHVALRSGFRHRQLAASFSEFPTIPRTQKGSLMHTNVNRGANDVQIRRIYNASDVAILATEVQRGRPRM